MNEFRIELGTMVTDSLTGFQGAVTARTQFLTGQNRYTVEKLAHDGDGIVVEDFDEERLVRDGNT